MEFSPEARTPALRQAATSLKNSLAIHPATAGMCLKLAGDIWLKTAAADGAKWDAAAADIVEGIAADLITRAQRLEKGNQDQF